MARDQKPLPFRADVLARLGRIEALLKGPVMAFIDDIEASVAQEKTVDDSILALLDALHQALVDAGVDPARQAAVLAALKTEQDRLVAAVTANTPAAPPTP